MPDKLYGLTEKDREQVQDLVDGFERKWGNVPGHSVPVLDDPMAPEVYIARTPAGGIPALTEGVGTGTGTGSGCDYDEPGYATCPIYRILPPTGTGSHDCDHHIEPVNGLTRTVFNLSSSSVAGNSWVLVVRDKWGSWFVPPSGGGGGEAGVVLVVQYLGVLDDGPCEGNLSSEASACSLDLYLAQHQAWTGECDCVYVVDANSKRLEVGVRYDAVRSGTSVVWPSVENLHLCRGGSDTASADLDLELDLWVTDAGDLSRVVEVEDSVGRLCGTADDERNLFIYTGPSRHWDPACEWSDIDTVYIAEMHGEELPTDVVPNNRFMGHYERHLSAADLGGTGNDDAEDCAPLYLVDCQGFTGDRIVVADVTCEEPGGTLPGSCSGLCIWQWIGTEWLLSFSNCANGCQCPSPPNFEGLVQGQEELRLCVASGGGGIDPGDNSLMAVYTYTEEWLCGKLLTVSGPEFSHYAGCCACSSSGNDPDGPDVGSGTGGIVIDTGTGTGGDCSGTCIYTWTDPGPPTLPHWELTTDACTGTDPDCDCVEPSIPGTFHGQTTSTDCEVPGGMLSVEFTTMRSGRVVRKPRASIGQAGLMSAGRKRRCKELKRQGLPCPDDPKADASRAIRGVRDVTRVRQQMVGRNYIRRYTVDQAPSLACRHRGEVKGQATCVGCTSNKADVYACAKHGECTVYYPTVGRKLCRDCSDRSPPAKAVDPARVAAPPVVEPVTPNLVLVPPPANVAWSYGVTTVESRRTTYLPVTLASLKAAGFGRPALFVDGSDDPRGWEERFGLVAHCRPYSLGVVGAWLAALHELYYANPRADRYALFQDDLTCCKNLKTYLERSPWPNRGYCNLYTFTAGNERIVAGKGVGWHEAGLVNPPERNPNLYQTGRGAVALVFDREAVMAALSSPHLVHKPSAPGDAGRIKIDGALVTAMNAAGFREFIHNPSLVQHHGHASSRPEAQDPNSGAYRYGHMKAQTYRGDDFDALTLLGES